MVIVEFFSETMIENMISALANAPERVVLVGDAKMMKKCDADFRNFLKAIGNDTTELEYRGVRIHDLAEVVRVVEGIVKDYPGCHFDLTGGDDLSMAAIGILYERYREEGVELHQYNIRTGVVYDCDLNGEAVSGEIPTLTVPQNLTLYGGTVVYEDQKPGRTEHWDMNEAFVKDINKMWEICRKDCGNWNYQISQLEAALSRAALMPEDELSFYLTADEIPTGFYTGGIFKDLEKKGLIHHVHRDSAGYGFTFKDKQVKKVLTKAGTILELVVYNAAGKAANKDGTPWFADRMTGVYIDWDGVIHGDDSEDVDTENEIDVLLMHGLVPVFISCKNGNVEVDELYKLNTVAWRFGGRYAKKVIAATTLGKNELNKKYFLDRAKQMKITVIDGIQEMTEAKLIKRLKAES